MDACFSGNHVDNIEGASIHLTFEIQWVSVCSKDVITDLICSILQSSISLCILNLHYKDILITLNLILAEK